MRIKMAIFVMLILIAEIHGDKLDIYDYIIVGSGPAGAVLANRLSTHSQIQVLLLEAGQRSNLISDTPSLYPYLEETPYDWNDTILIPAYPEAGIEERSVLLPQGRALGGSSVINSMLYVRGNKYDFSNWEHKGAKGWNWIDVYPFYLKSEHNLNPDIVNKGLHDNRGELFVQRAAYFTHLKEKYLQAAQELGFKIGDVNGENQSVFTSPQITTLDGRRWSVDKAFLNRIRGRQNLKVLTSAHVKKILIRNNSTKGVLYFYGGQLRKALARHEVILSAGAVRSPQLLMISGIGPADELKKLQLDVISDLPVGENLQDHPSIKIPIYKIRNLTITPKDYEIYLLGGHGPLASPLVETLGFFNTIYNHDPDWPDSEIVLVSLPSSSFDTIRRGKGTVYCDALVQRPKSRGRIKLKDANINTPPIIESNYLTEDDDLKILVEGLKMCQKLANTNALKNIGEKVIIPNYPICEKHERGSDEYNRCLAMKLVRPSYHLVGTCKMGDPDDTTTVVDPHLKVKGVERLRVVDISVVPEIITGHPYTLAIVIGEKASDYILFDYFDKHG